MGEAVRHTLIQRNIKMVQELRTTIPVAHMVEMGYLASLGVLPRQAGMGKTGSIVS